MITDKETTPTFVIKIPLNLKSNDYRSVEKSMNVANSIYNDMLSEGKKRINRLRADKTYWKLIKDYNDAKEHNKKRSKIKDKEAFFVNFSPEAFYYDKNTNEQDNSFNYQELIKSITARKSSKDPYKDAYLHRKKLKESR